MVTGKYSPDISNPGHVHMHNIDDGFRKPSCYLKPCSECGVTVDSDVDNQG